MKSTYWINPKDDYGFWNLNKLSCKKKTVSYEKNIGLDIRP